MAKQDDIRALHIASDFHAEATELRLSAEQYDAFVAALDGPTKPKPRLEELMKTTAAFDRESEPIRAANDGVDESGEQTDYEADLRASIERGLADADAGRLVVVEDLMTELGIDS